LPACLTGSADNCEYRLAFVQAGECILRYDNAAGKGDHRHSARGESRYRFTTLDRLFADFEADVERLLHEDGDP